MQVRRRLDDDPLLDDDLLAAEIVLYGELVLAASEAAGETSLSQRRIDRALGLGG